MTKRIATLTLAGALCAAALTGTALTAHAVNPDNGVWFYLTNESRNASTATKRVNYTARVNTADGCKLDVTSVSPSTSLHTWGMEMLAQCLGASGQQLSKNASAGGIAGPVSSSDDLRLACPFSRGDLMQGGVGITN